MAEIVIVYYSKPSKMRQFEKGWWFTVNSAPSLDTSIFKKFNFFANRDEGYFFTPWEVEGIKGYWTPSSSLSMSLHKLLIQNGFVVQYVDSPPFKEDNSEPYVDKQHKRWVGDYAVVRKTLLALLQYPDIYEKDYARLKKYWTFLKKRDFLYTIQVENLLKLCKRPRYFQWLNSKGLTRVVR